MVFLAFASTRAGAWGNPNYVANEYRAYVATGAKSSQVSTQPLFQNHGEFWCALNAYNNATHYYAEVAVDITWDSATSKWHTVVYAAYSDPSVWPGGYQIGSKDLGESSDWPPAPSVSVYLAYGTLWAFNANDATFATHDYSTSWSTIYVAQSLESYAQPLAHTSGEIIVTFSGIQYLSNGNWYNTAYNPPAGFQERTPTYKVYQSDSGNSHQVLSSAA